MSAALLLAKSQLRFARRHPLGVAAALLGVVLATTAVVGVHRVAQSLRAELQSAASAAAFGHTHVVTRAPLAEVRAALAEADYFELRRRWRRGELPGIETMIPVVDDFLAVGGRSYRLLGFEPVAVGGPGAGTTPLPATTAPVGQGRANLAAFLTEDVVLAAADAAEAIAASGALSGVRVEVVEGAAADGATLFADLPTAQRLLQREGQLDAIWIRAVGTRARLLDWLDGLLPGVAAALPGYADPIIAGFSVTARSQWNPLQRFADASTFNLGMLALLSVVMAAFLAAQASFSNAARRRREFEQLAVLGVPFIYPRCLMVVEGLLLGGLGAALGVVAGLVVAQTLLSDALADGLAAELDAWLLGKAIFCGVLVTAIGPLFALRPSKVQPGVVAALAAALTAAGLAQGSLGAVFAALLAGCFLQVAGIAPSVGGAVRLVATKLTSRLASRANLRAATARGREIKLAMGALSVAVAAAMGMGLMVESLRHDFTAMLQQRVPAGIYVGGSEGAFDDGDVAWARGLAGVREVRRYGEFDAHLPQGRVLVVAAELDAGEASRYGYRGALTDGAMLNEVGARRLGLKVGDALTVRAGGVEADVHVAHVFRDFGAALPRLLLPLEVAQPFAASMAWRRLSIRADDDEIDQLVATLGRRYGAHRVRDDEQIRRFANAVFDRSFQVSQALAVVALAVAAVGMYAALSTLLNAQARTFRLLSAVGYSRAEIWRQGLAQASILGVVAGLAALPFGVFVAWVLCALVNPQAFGWSIELRFDGAALAYPMLLSVAAAVLAGAVPTYRAAYASTRDGA